jgi:hypothetical protein
VSNHTTLIALAVTAVVLLATVGCQDYGLEDQSDWGPADQPEDLAQTIYEDLFQQDTAEASDILFVVDNSGSMVEEQQALADNFDVFIQYLVDTPLDYHIGVVTLDDPEDPPIGVLHGTPNVLDPGVAGDIEALFMQTIDAIEHNPEGTCEVGLEASYRALSPAPEGHLDTYNLGFYRDEALLSVIIVSDEDDGSIENSDCPTPSAFIPYTEYSPWFLNIKGAHSDEMVFFTAITGDADTGCSGDWGTAEPGWGYLQVVDALGPERALFFSICENDWSSVMSTIGLQAAGLRTSFHLSLVPVEGTLEVFIDLDGDGPDPAFQIQEDPTYGMTYAFVYDRVANALLFTVDTMPPEGATLRVTYQLAQDA